MMPLRNHRRELFAQAIAQGKSAAEALRVAGYADNFRNGTRMKMNEDVQRRIADLQAIAAGRAEITTASLIEDAQRIQDMAEKAGQATAAIQALKAKAILSGKWVESRTVEQTVVNKEPATMSLDEIRDEIRKFRDAGSAPGDGAGDRAPPEDPQRPPDFRVKH